MNELPAVREREGIEARRRVVPKGGDPFQVARELELKKTAVRALDSVDEVDMMVSYFLERGRYRDACLFVLGCNTGLRISDILRFRWRDILIDDDRALIKNLTVETKTQKRKVVYFNAAVAEAVWLYKEHLGRQYNRDDYIFVSEGYKKGYVPMDYRNDDPEERIKTLEVQPLHTRSAARIIRNAAKELGLYTGGRHISSHSMRKTALNVPLNLISGVTMPEEVYDTYKSLELARMMGNHSNTQITLAHYSEIEDRVLSKIYENMNLGLGAIREHRNKLKQLAGGK